MPPVSSTLWLHSLYAQASRRRLRTKASFRPHIEWLEDRSLLTVFTVSNIDDMGSGSLRQALLDANASANDTAGVDQIVFAIPGAAPHTITPLSILPTITEPVILDATTQPGYVGFPVIELNGSLSGAAAGLNVTGGNTVIRGFAINRFAAAGSGGIVLSGPGGNTIQGNYIGTNLAGDAIFPAGSRQNFGVIVFGNDFNIIGTDGDGTNDVAEGNIITGQDSAGVLLQPGNAAELPDNNVIAGNLIGTSADLVHAYGNGRYGVFLFDGGTGNRIGTNADALSDITERNVISGNPEGGILINGNSNVVAGNLIGSDASGQPVGNGDGVVINGHNNVIGGNSPAASNEIAFNSVRGVVVSGSSSGNTIRWNTIFSNGSLGIDLAAAGEAVGTVTPNDVADADSGPNTLANFPLILTARSSGSELTISGEFSGAAQFQNSGSPFTIEFFANNNSNPPGAASGELVIGSTSVLYNTLATSFTATLPITLQPGMTITATTTDPDGNTSEFSAQIAVSFAAIAIDGNLVVRGTAANDTIVVDATDPGAVTVTINGVEQPPPFGIPFALNPATGRLIVDAEAGDDIIRILGSVFSELHGGEGRDYLYGGSGRDIMWGGAGDDYISAGDGDDFLIGGFGSDLMNGGNGADVLAGGEFLPGLQHNGTEAFEYDTLKNIGSGWSQGTADTDLNSGYADDITDTERDTITGGSGGDWIICDTTGASPDMVTDFHLGQNDKLTTLGSAVKPPRQSGPIPNSIRELIGQQVALLKSELSELGVKQALKLESQLDRRAKNFSTLSKILAVMNKAESLINGNLK